MNHELTNQHHELTNLMEEHEVNSIYEGNKITGLSVSSLKICSR